MPAFRSRLEVTEFLSSSVNILKNMVSFDKSEQFDGFSKVVIIVSDEIEYSAGDDTGRTLTLNCPWGTQEIANNILQSIKGFQYQPMTANGALVDPSAEIGDGISANGIYSGIYSQMIKFNSNLPSDISAPSDEEIDEEFPYKSSQERKVERQNREIRASLFIQAGRITQEVTERQNQAEALRATLNVQADEIEAKVSKEGGDDSSNFWWKLLSDGWNVGTDSKTVFSVDKDGAYVDGEIRATSGKIGNWDINSNYLSYNGQTWGGTNTTGAYIGQSGIQLGKNFKVDMQGNLTAARGTFGSLSVNSNGSTVGSYSGSLSGCGGSVRGISGSVSGITGSLSTGISVGGKNIETYVGDIVAGKITADYINAKTATLKTISINGKRFAPGTIRYMNSSGTVSTARVLLTQD